MKLYRISWTVEAFPRVLFRTNEAKARREARRVENAYPSSKISPPVVDKVTFAANRAGIIDALEGRFLTTERVY
jgi:hypothetical protein